jgi:FKBP-type peptidyl-prolyl cis-trans isomerase
MRSRFAITCATLSVIALSGCEAGAGGSSALDTAEQRASYAVGINVGNSLREAREFLDMPAFQRGLREAMASEEHALEPAELQAAMERLNELMAEARQAQAEESLAAGQAYLAENAEREGVVTTESGLQYEVIEEGEGEPPVPGDQVTVHYRGTLIDGTEFDSSYERDEPATFDVGGVIAGFSEGLQLMRPGATYRLVIPANLAYGPQGAGQNIGPNATLIFEVEMIEVTPGGEPG